MNFVAIISGTTLYDDLFNDLSAELSVTDSNYNADILKIKIENAIREVGVERKYPGYYSEDRIGKDLQNYYSNIRNIALFDYNTLGAEFQESSKESDNSRTYISRDKLFYGVYPLAR